MSGRILGLRPEYIFVMYMSDSGVHSYYTCPHAVWFHGERHMYGFCFFTNSILDWFTATSQDIMNERLPDNE